MSICLGHQKLRSPFPSWCIVVVLQLLSCVQQFATPWTVAHQASLSSTVSWSLLKSVSTESVMPSKHPILCRPLPLLSSIFLSIRVHPSQSALHIRCPKHWSFSLSSSPSTEHSGLISFRVDWFGLCTVRKTLKSSLQHHNSLAPSLPYGLTLISIYDLQKNHSIDCMDPCWQSDVSAL